MNENKNLLIGVGVVAVLLVGYLLYSNMQKTPAAPQPAATTTTTKNSASPSAAMSKVTVTLSEQNKSGESGTATLTEVNGKVKVTLKMTGAGAVAQPAHIHVGVCPDVGAVKYPLTSVVNGMSETMLDVTLAQLKSQLPLGINVHKSAAEAKVYVSCGDLKL